jgi:hypothetical protein
MTATVIEEGKFCDLGTYDAIALKLLSLNVLRVRESYEHGYLRNAACIASLCHYMIVDVSIANCPQQPGFDETWEHVGAHQHIGRMYWNWFKMRHPNAVLVFHDSPDFSGRMGDGTPFAGDINQVGIGTFIRTMANMPRHSLWISVSEKRQVIIEPLLNIYKAGPFKSGKVNLKELADETETCDALWSRCQHLPGHRIPIQVPEQSKQE